MIDKIRQNAPESGYVVKAREKLEKKFASQIKQFTPEALEKVHQQLKNYKSTKTTKDLEATKVKGNTETKNPFVKKLHEQLRSQFATEDNSLAGRVTNEPSKK